MGLNTSSKSSFLQLASVIYLIILNLIINADVGLDVPLMVEIGRKYDKTELDFSLFVIVPFTILTGIFSFLWGYLSDKYQRKKILLFNILFGALSLACVGISLNFSLPFSLVAFFRVLSAVGLSGIIPVSMSMVVDLISEHRRGMVFGWMGIAGYAGYGLGFLLSGILIKFGLHLPYLVGASIGVGFFLLGLLVPEPARAQGEDLLRELIQKEEFSYSYRIEAKALKQIFSKPLNLWLFGFVLFFSIPGSALGIFFIPFLVRNHSFNEFWATLYLLAVFSSQVFGQVVFGRVGDLWYQKNQRGRAWTMLATILLSLPFLLLAFGLDFDLKQLPHLLGFSVLLLLGGFFMVGSNPLTLTVFCDINLPEHRGTVLALNYIGWLVARIISAPLCSGLAEKWGMNYAPAFFIICLLLIPASFFLLPVLWQIIPALEEKTQLLKSRLQPLNEN